MKTIHSRLQHDYSDVLAAFPCLSMYIGTQMGSIVEEQIKKRVHAPVHTQVDGQVGRCASELMFDEIMEISGDPDV